MLAGFSCSGCQKFSSLFIGVKSIDAEQLHETLEKGSKPLIMDIREKTKCQGGHIAGSICLNEASIAGYLSQYPRPKGHQIIILCEDGWTSQITTATVMGQGYENVYSLHGGMQSWESQGYPLEVGPAIVVDPRQLEVPVVEISILSQFAMTTAAFIVKPIYILLSFFIIVILWRRKERDFLLLRNAMILFFIGENACSANYLLSANSSKSLEFIHGLGMVGMYLFLAWALVVFFDERIFNYSNFQKHCLFQKLCNRCWKHEDVRCGLHRIARYAVPALAFFALVPLTMPLRPFEIIMPVFSSNVLWLKDFWNLFFEFRVYPILGAFCLLVAFTILGKGKDGFIKSQRPFFLGVGLTSYSFFRFGLLLTFRENQAWADWWEEATEFVTIFLILLSLILFRFQLNIRIPWFRPLAQDPFKKGKIDRRN